MAQAEPLEPTANRRTVRRDVVIARQFQAQFIQGQVTLLRQAVPHPVVQVVQLARPPQIALLLGRKRAGLPAQLNHVIDEFRRNSEMSHRLPVTMTVVNKPDDTLS